MSKDKQQVIFKKKSITERDLVLIYIEDKPSFYGRVEQITADVKPKWWRVKFVLLTFPPQLVTWIIDDEQIRGADFTMGGTPIRIEKLVLPKEAEEKASKEPESPSKDKGKKKQARVLSLNPKKSDKKK